jgi:peptidoglycan/LPS O-acetylase OafA/YrhL
LGLDYGTAQEPVHALIGATVAEIAVNVFFVLSGYLVTRSLLGHNDILDYILARALRIYPALIVLVLLTVFVLGPLTTTLALDDYFNTRSVYGYLVYDSVALSLFHTRFELPGVFENLPYAGIVNGSLWNLPWEMLMYGLLAVLFLTRLIHWPLLWIFPILTLNFLVMLNVVELPVWALSSRDSSFSFSAALCCTVWAIAFR